MPFFTMYRVAKYIFLSAPVHLKSATPAKPEHWIRAEYSTAFIKIAWKARVPDWVWLSSKPSDIFTNLELSTNMIQCIASKFFSKKIDHFFKTRNLFPIFFRFHTVLCLAIR